MVAWGVTVNAPLINRTRTECLRLATLRRGRRPRASVGPRDRAPLDWQGEREDAPGSHLALDPHAAAVQLDEPLRQRQAQPGPLRFRCPRPYLAKLLEDVLLVLGSNLYSAVPHGDLHHGVHQSRR